MFIQKLSASIILIGNSLWDKWCHLKKISASSEYYYKTFYDWKLWLPREYFVKYFIYGFWIVVVTSYGVIATIDDVATEPVIAIIVIIAYEIVVIAVIRVVFYLARSDTPNITWVAMPWVQSPIRPHSHRCISSLHACSYIQQSGHSVKSLNAKNTKKSLIHENAYVNITCEFGDGDISRSRSRLPHGHTDRRPATSLADWCLFCHACNAGAPGRTVLCTDGVLRVNMTK